MSWYIRTKDKVLGPFAPNDIRRLAGNGQLTAAHLVARTPDGPWARAGSVKGLVFAVDEQASVPPRSDRAIPTGTPLASSSEVNESHSCASTVKTAPSTNTVPSTSMPSVRVQHPSKHTGVPRRLWAGVVALNKWYDDRWRKARECEQKFDAWIKQRSLPVRLAYRAGVGILSLALVCALFYAILGSRSASTDSSPPTQAAAAHPRELAEVDALLERLSRSPSDIALIEEVDRRLVSAARSILEPIHKELRTPKHFWVNFFDREEGRRSANRSMILERLGFRDYWRSLDRMGDEGNAHREYATRQYAGGRATEISSQIEPWAERIRAYLKSNASAGDGKQRLLNIANANGGVLAEMLARANPLISEQVLLLWCSDMTDEKVSDCIEDVIATEASRIVAEVWASKQADVAVAEVASDKPPAVTQKAAESYDVTYQIMSPGPTRVVYRNATGGTNEKMCRGNEDIRVTLPANETAWCNVVGLDQVSPVAIWLYVNGKRVCASSGPASGGGTATCSGDINSKER